MQSWIVGASLLALCLLGAALIASIEAALVGVPQARVHKAVEDRVAGAGRLLYWVRAPGQILATLHMTRFCLLLSAGMAALDLLSLAPSVPVPRVTAAVGVGVTALVLSHMLPRIVAKQHPYEWARATMWLVRLLVFCLYPIVLLVSAAVRGLAILVGRRELGTSSAFWMPDELGQISNDARAAGLGESGEDLLLSIIEFSDTTIREIMAPRTEMVATATTCTQSELRQVIIDAGHSRIPVYEETIDNIVGVLHVKDLFIWETKTQDGGGERIFDLKSLVRGIFYVPEVMQISELLREFQRRKTHMAIVVDEYGGTAGVVTLEDIIEEIVGEIQDEYDVEEKQFRVIGDKIIADARVSVWDLEETLGVGFPEDGGYETLAGFLMAQIGYLPETGAVISWGGLTFTIKEANEKRIGMVEVERPAKGEASPAAAAR